MPILGERLLSNLVVNLKGSASSTLISNKLVPGSTPADNSADTFLIRGSERNTCREASKESALKGAVVPLAIRDRT